MRLCFPCSLLLLSHSHHLSAHLAPVVALHDQLMCTRHQLQAVVVVELLADVLPKRVASPAGRDAPATAVIWVGPQEVTHGAFMWHLTGK